MAKDPAFLFYPGDFNTGTQFFTDEQVGKYMRLLMAQHQHGHLTDDQVIHICKSYDNHVMAKFVKDKKGLWYNERLEIEVIKRKEYSESRGNNRKGRGKEKNISVSYDPHMENRNENIDVLVLDVNKFLKRENNPNTMDVRFMVQQWTKEGHKNILDQLKAMKVLYQKNEWKFPNRIDTLTLRFMEHDWIEQLKDLDPERIAENIQNGRTTRKPEPDTIGVSKPGSLG